MRMCSALPPRRVRGTFVTAGKAMRHGLSVDLKSPEHLDGNRRLARCMALTDDEKQRIREEELVRLLAREEYQSRKRQRTVAPFAIGGVCVLVAALMFAFTILRTI